MQEFVVDEVMNNKTKHKNNRIKLRINLRIKIIIWINSKLPIIILLNNN
jgi:hypothetical protein